MCLLLGASTADFAENRESSLTRLCQGPTAGGTTVLYPNTEQSPPSPSDQPETPSSEHNHVKSYSSWTRKRNVSITEAVSVKGFLPWEPRFHWPSAQDYHFGSDCIATQSLLTPRWAVHAHEVRKPVWCSRALNVAERLPPCWGRTPTANCIV